MSLPFRRILPAFLAFAASGLAAAQPVETDAALQSRCETLLSKIRRAYADAPAVEVKCVESHVVSDFPFDPVEHLIRIDHDRRAYIQDNNNRLWAYDRSLFYEHAQRDGEFAHERYAGDLMDAFARFQAASLLFVSLAIEQPRDMFFKHLAFGMLGPLDYKECGPTTLEDGREVVRIHFYNTAGDILLDADPESWGIVRMEANFKNPQDVLNYHKTFQVETRFLDALDPPIEFHPEGKIELSSVITLLTDPKKRGTTGVQYGLKLIEVGQIAPAFDSRWIQGKKYRFAPADGRWKLLAFWRSEHSATEGLLQQCKALAEWGREKGIPFDVLPVNAREAGLGADRWERAIDYWEKADLGLDLLFDERDEIAALYRADPLPVIVLVDPHGVIQVSRAGATEPFADEIRAAVTAK